MSCSRVNPQAGCNPIKVVVLSFASPVARATILAAPLDTADGTRPTPRTDADDTNDDWLTIVHFTGPPPQKVEPPFRLPAIVAHQCGRTLRHRREKGIASKETCT